MSNFAFLKTSAWKEIHQDAARAEHYVLSDARTPHVMLSATKHPNGPTTPTPQRLLNALACQTPSGFFTPFRMTYSEAMR